MLFDFAKVPPGQRANVCFYQARLSCSNQLLPIERANLVNLDYSGKGLIILQARVQIGSAQAFLLFVSMSVIPPRESGCLVEGL